MRKKEIIAGITLAFLFQSVAGHAVKAESAVPAQTPTWEAELFVSGSIFCTTEDKAKQWAIDQSKLQGFLLAKACYTTAGPLWADVDYRHRVELEGNWVVYPCTFARAKRENASEKHSSPNRTEPGGTQ